MFLDMPGSLNSSLEQIRCEGYTVVRDALSPR
jgi:hypothetical protein